jgi:hypothetical protein
VVVIGRDGGWGTGSDAGGGVVTTGLVGTAGALDPPELPDAPRERLAGGDEDQDGDGEADPGDDDDDGDGDGEPEPVTAAPEAGGRAGGVGRRGAGRSITTGSSALVPVPSRSGRTGDATSSDVSGPEDGTGGRSSGAGGIAWSARTATITVTSAAAATNAPAATPGLSTRRDVRGAP